MDDSTTTRMVSVILHQSMGYDKSYSFSAMLVCKRDERYRVFCAVRVMTLSTWAFHMQWLVLHAADRKHIVAAPVVVQSRHNMDVWCGVACAYLSNGMCALCLI